MYGPALAVFFVSVIGWGLLCVHPFSKPGNAGCRLALAPGIGIAVIALLALGVALGSSLWLDIWKPAGLAITGVSLIGWFLFWRDWRKRWSAQAWWGVILFMALLVLRLIFVQSVLLPPYHDSPEHYELVQSLLFPFQSADVPNFLLDSTARYYHLGFHSLTAWWVSVTGLATTSALSLLGQVFLAVYPFALFAFLETLSGERRFSLFAAVLSAIGWPMPAFAANWGKYPALAVIAVFPAVLTLWLSAVRGRQRAFTRYALLLIFSVGLVVLHTRALVLLALAACCVALTRPVRFPASMPFWLGLLISVAILPVAYWLREPLLGRYFGLWDGLTLLVVLGLPFAFSFSPRLSVAGGLFMLGIYLASVTMLPVPLKAYSRFLLDGPFVDVALVLPLSVLVGLEVAGVLSKLSARPRLQAGLEVLFLGTILVLFSLQGSLRADPCCNYVQEGDLRALEWIKNETEPEAVVLVAGYEMRNYQVATDGGAWVRALTGRNMNKVPYDLPWDKASAREFVCRPEWNEPYIYAGGQEFSFDRNLLHQPKWYEVVYEAGGTRIYKVRSCDR